MRPPLKMWQPDSCPSLTFAIHHSTGTLGLMPFTSHNHGNARDVPATVFFHPACCPSSSEDPASPSSSLDGSVRAAAMKGKCKNASFKKWWNSFSPLTPKRIEKYHFLPADGAKAARFEQKETGLVDCAADVYQDAPWKSSSCSHLCLFLLEDDIVSRSTPRVCPS